MKKLLLFLLILALFLTGCNTPPADEGTTPPTVDGGDETPNNEQGEQAPADNDDDSTTKPTFTIKYPEPKPELKPPAVPITNKDDLQDETADFLYVFNLKYGEFVRGEKIYLEIEMTNNMETSYTWVGSSSGFFPGTILYTMVNGEKYMITNNGIAINDDYGPREAKPGESNTRVHGFTIPNDAPLGEYTLSCIFNGKTTDFEGYFTLTQ